MSENAKWDQLGRVYREEGIVLALGAGVSQGSGLPNWPNLLKILVEDSIGKNYPGYFEELERKLPLPVIASVLEQSCSDGRKGNKRRATFVKERRAEFIKRVREALYRDFYKRFDLPVDPVMSSTWPPEQRKKAEENQRKLVRGVCANNKTLRAVAALCTVPNADVERFFEANVELIRAIVTFNLDSLLQRYTRARYRSNHYLLRTVERATEAPRLDTISVYHMHGNLRFDSKARRPSKEAPDAVVLTEQDYFNFFDDAMRLFSYTFMYLLREVSCLFIGLSMQDENIRRLLHYFREERVQSYQKKHPTYGENRAIEKSHRHFAILKRSDSTSIDSAIENSLLALGTRVLWIADHDEIPGRFEKIYGDRWDLVF